MGRSLSNAMVNLGIESECEEALYEVCVCVRVFMCTGIYNVLLSLLSACVSVCHFTTLVNSLVWTWKSSRKRRRMLAWGMVGLGDWQVRTAEEIQTSIKNDDCMRVSTSRNYALMHLSIAVAY